MLLSLVGSYLYSLLKVVTMEGLGMRLELLSQFVRYNIIIAKLLKSGHATGLSQECTILCKRSYINKIYAVKER